MVPRASMEPSDIATRFQLPRDNNHVTRVAQASRPLQTLLPPLELAFSFFDTIL